MRILHLTIYRIYFDKIKNDVKKVEFRKRTTYWEKRLLNRQYDEIYFRNGYGKNRPFMRVECKNITQDENWFYIKLGKVLEVTP